MSSSEHNPFAAPEVEQYIAPHGGPEFNTPELRQVGLGLKLVYLSIVAVILGAMIMGVGVATADGPGDFFNPVTIFAIGLILIGYVLNIVGPLLCLAVPEASRGKGLILASVAFHLINVLITILVFVEVLPEGGAINSASNLFAITSWILFMIFLRRLALFIRHEQHADRARAILISAIVLTLMFVGYAIYLWSVVFGNREPPLFFSLIGMGLGVAALVLFVSYANLVNRVSKLLRP